MSLFPAISPREPIAIFLPRLRALITAFSILAIATESFAAEFKIRGQTFTVPEGFKVSLAAGANLAPRPVSASFDSLGFLYVTDSSGSNDKPDVQLKNPTHRIVRLEDTDGDGVFDKAVVFAEKVMFPQGCLWLDGSVYVAAPPSIWKFTDTDGDGVADRREEWWKGGTLTGCANDVHGPYRGPDGYIYWTKGAFAEQTHALGNGGTLKDKAAHIYRARPDGSDLDVIMSGGMDNPVEVAFTPDGEAIFTSTFIDFSQPGFRDGIGHAIYGGVYGKANDVLEGGWVKRTGPELMHPFYQAGAAAECGLCRYESSVFGAEYHDNFFATAFNLRKVTRHILRMNGASYASADSDFLVSENQDFHPTDVLPDADGSLLVVDTGGWYKLCCPSSQLAKPEVLGGIYRVGRKTAAMLKMAERGGAYAALVRPPGLANYTLPATLKRAVWKADPTNAKWFREMVENNAAAAATNAVSAHVVRAAAEGLGRLRDREAVAILLQATGLSVDLNARQVLVQALIEIGASTATRDGLSSGNPAIQRAALVALDQMGGGDSKPVEVIPLLTATDESLRAAASWVVGHHLDWSEELAAWFRVRLGVINSNRTSLVSLHTQFPILARSEAGQALLAEAVTKPGYAVETRIAALDAMAYARLKQPPPVWKEAVLQALGGSNPGSESDARRVAAIRAAHGLSADARIAEALDAIARDEKLPSSLRLEALSALPAGTGLSRGAFEFLQSRLAPENTPAIRVAAASGLSRARLDVTQRTYLIETLKVAGPLEFSRLLLAFDAGGDEALGANLLAALQVSKSAKALNAGQLRPHFAKFPEPTRKAAEEFLATLNSDAARQSAHLDALLAELKAGSGDIRRGQMVFNSTKAACLACHKVGYFGGTVGPDLTSIGPARTERDLLESIVYPSASFVRSFEPYVVEMKTGETQGGILRRDEPDEVVLVTGPNTEVRIARAELAELRPGTVSLMPQGLDQQLSKQELADLLAFLKNAKWGPQ